MVGKLFAVVIAMIAVVNASAANVDFQGYLYSGESGLPIISGRIIVGTFKPGFDVLRYPCIYGDVVCNLDGNAYYQAVADGNFIPLSNVNDINPFNVLIPNKDPSIVLTGPGGYFSGTGTTDAVGSQLWIFGFPQPEPFLGGLLQALASGNSDAFRVPAVGTTLIDAAQTNIFVFGEHYGNGIRTTVVPFPEPTSLSFFSIAAVMLGASRYRTRRN